MTEETTTLRRCIGSERFGIEPHEAPPEEFPVQPSQKDGLGRMCRPHWNAYTAGLAREAKARKAAASGDVPTVDPEAAAPSEGITPEPEAARKRTRRSTAPEAAAQGDAG